MGCCTSRPRGDGNEPPNSFAGASPQAPTQPYLPNPNRPASSSHSVATSTGTRPPVPLDQQFNAPLRPHVWQAKPRKPWRRSQWAKKREEFFDTRVTNRAEIWGSLKVVVELLDQAEVETAQGIVDASEITLPTGDLVDGAYDKFGNLYQLPAFVVSAPTNLLEDHETERIKKEVDTSAATRSETSEAATVAITSEKAKQGSSPVDSVEIKARLSDRGRDVIVTVGKNDTTKSLISAVAASAGLPQDKVRIAYMGKVLKPNKGFVAQGWQPGHVVNALVAP